MTRIFEELIEIFKGRCTCNESAQSLKISDGSNSALVVFDDNSIYVSGKSKVEKVKNDYNSLSLVVDLVRAYTN